MILKQPPDAPSARPALALLLAVTHALLLRWAHTNNKQRPCYLHQRVVRCAAKHLALPSRL